MRGRLLLLLLAGLMTSCQEIDPMGSLIQLTLPESHYDLAQKFEGEMPDFQEWWKQFDSKSLEQLLAIAIENNPSLGHARHKFRELCYDYRIMEEDVEALLNELNGEMKVAHYSPYAIKENQSPTLAIKNILKCDRLGRLVQRKNHHLKLFDYHFHLDILGKNENWREVVKSDLTSHIESLKDTFSSIRLSICKKFTQLISLKARYQAKKELVSQIEEILRQIQTRFDAGIMNASDLEIAKKIQYQNVKGLDDLEEKLKKAHYALLKDLGTNNLDQLKEILGEDMRLPKITQEVFVGIPLQVVQGRPDVRIKLEKLKQASANLGLAYKDQFPVAKVITTLESTSKTLFDIFSTQNYIFHFGYKFDTNMLDPTRAVAKVMKHKSQHQAAQIQYKAAVCASLIEVAHKMLDIVSKEKELASIEQNFQHVDSQRLKNKAKANSSGKYLIDLLYSEVALHNVADQKMVLETDRIVHSMELIRALGG